MIFTITRRAIWYLPKNITWTGATAVATAVNIVHFHMKKYPNPKSPSSSKNAATKKKTDDPKPVSFFDVVYKIARKIPKGRVTTYGAIAEAADIKLTPRMVGWAMNGAGNAKPAVPAHRVVNRIGELSGRQFFATPTLMQELLEQEGVIVNNDKVSDFKNVFWDPGKPKAATAKKTVRKKA